MLKFKDYLYLIGLGIVGGVIVFICALTILGLQDLFLLR